jgi:glycosyltransferase involved in cell wall biosynthesis
MPTYNRAYVIWKAIQSIIDQTLTAWELIVVNDGSTDCTLRLLEEFHEPRIRILTTANRGPSAARNAGLTIAQAPYIAYLDSDNICSPAFLETMHRAIQQTPHSVLWHCGYHMTTWERTRTGEWFIVSRGSYPGVTCTAEQLWRLKGVDTNRMVHRRMLAAEIGGWDEACGWLEDWDFFVRVYLRYPGQIESIPDMLIDYRQVYGTGADGICAQARENRYAEVAARQYLLRKWSDHPNFAAHQQLSRQVDSMQQIRAPSEPGSHDESKRHVPTGKMSNRSDRAHG